MKSSTIRRSNLSKEKMAVLEALSKYRQESYDNSPNVYVRPNKEKELDVLWQNFKINQKADKAPGVYLATGFVAGAVVMLVITTLISFSTRNISSKANFAHVPKVKNEKAAQFVSNAYKQVASFAAKCKANPENVAGGIAALTLAPAIITADGNQDGVADIAQKNINAYSSALKSAEIFADMFESIA